VCVSLCVCGRQRRFHWRALIRQSVPRTITSDVENNALRLSLGIHADVPRSRSPGIDVVGPCEPTRRCWWCGARESETRARGNSNDYFDVRCASPLPGYRLALSPLTSVA